MRVNGGKIVSNLGNTYEGKWQLDAPAAFPLEKEPPVTTEERSGWASEIVWTLHMSDKLVDLRDCPDTSYERQIGGPGLRDCLDTSYEQQIGGTQRPSGHFI